MRPMDYYISYKGKHLGPPMTKEQAEMKLISLSKSFDGLQISSAPAMPDNQETEGLLGQLNASDLSQAGRKS
jgi:hypothetical protein